MPAHRDHTFMVLTDISITKNHLHLNSVNSSLQVKKGGSKYQEIATCNHADILHFLCRGIINLLIYFLIHYQDTAVEG